MNEFLNALRSYRFPKAIQEIGDIFGMRSRDQVIQDLQRMAQRAGKGFQFDSSTVTGFFRPDISIPAYNGKYPEDRLAPIITLFDRVNGGDNYTARVTRTTSRDFRGKRLTYDEHDGTDFAIPIGTELVAAAPGRVVMIRDNWVRGGLTIALDHGDGLITEYTHCWKSKVELGQAVARGEVVALSGATGVDMLISFPWYPPHIHFLVRDQYGPFDPFLQPDEPERGGTWLKRNSPGVAALVEEKEPIPDYSPVDMPVIRGLIPYCTDNRVLEELKKLEHHPEYLAAFIEDSLIHDHFAWPDHVRKTNLRNINTHSDVRLTLPLTSKFYGGAYAADAPAPLNRLPVHR